ncbi:MAG: TonB-dependent receptor [Thermoanaerobaculia bacterium]
MSNVGIVRRLRLIATAVVFLVAATLFAASTINGTVRDLSGERVAGAIVTSGTASVTTDARGNFTLVLPDEGARIEVSHPSYRPLVRMVDSGVEQLELIVAPLMTVSEEVVVNAIRADEATPITKKDLSEEEIDAINFGQDVPAMISRTPSMTTYSDSGVGGSGYSYFTLRGIGQSRINMTLNGVPLNDPEETVLYFANFVDFASSMESIQIQRGVGTSTVGAPSYGGSINFASVDLDESQNFEVQLGGGSFGTRRGSIAVQTGNLGAGIAGYARFSINKTDGFRDHSGVDQTNLFLSLGKQNERSLWRVTGFSGREESQLAYLAVDEATLEQDLRFNPLDPAERDDFGQDMLQVQYTRAIGDDSTVVATAYYHGAQGWFGIWDDPIAKQNLLKYSIDGHFVGTMLTFSSAFGPATLNAGIHANDFTRDHFLRVAGDEIYNNTGEKNEANAFAKLGWDTGRWHLYGDAQVRYAKFSYDGDIEIDPIEWTFFNPKVGARYALTPSSSLYASVGAATREPTRNDMFAGEDNPTIAYDLEAVEPERVVDFEAGYQISRGDLSFDVNLYAMEFRNEIALTGELSEIGLPLRRNVDRSFRRGVEFDASWQATPSLRLTHASNFSHNRISEWTQSYDVYDAEWNWSESVLETHRDVPPLLTPEVIVNQGIEYNLRGSVLGALARYVGESHLDNTGDDAYVTPSFVVLDLTAAVPLDRVLRGATLRVLVNNALDHDEIYQSGYSYQFYVDDAAGRTRTGTPYFYPGATRNFVVMIDYRM